MDFADFQNTVCAYYAAYKRDLPWRVSPTPYHVLVSEIMLQQTQVPRVVPKFNQFIERFPTLADLAAAQLGDVLAVWSGLGYNRRAKYLWQAAQAVQQLGGDLPKDMVELVKLPGVGKNTAGAIIAYAFNRPAVFIETNIRTVFIHHFFADKDKKVSDVEITQLVAATLPTKDVRDWYYALMDYGTHLKATAGGKLDQVAGHRPQSKFSGSLRQVRGRVLKVLLAGGLTRKELNKTVGDDRLPQVLDALVAEGLIRVQNNRYTI